MKKTHSLAVVALFVSLSATAQAKIFLDLEHDPLPLVEITVVLPVGFEAKSQADVGVGNLLSDIVENGTADLDRQSFLEKLAEYGASYDFSVANHESEWKLSFPIVAGKDYSQLKDLLAENWKQPRFDEATFKTAKIKLGASLKGALDSDGSLAIVTARRWLNKREFGGFPLLMEGLEAVKLDAVKRVFESDFQKVKDAWAGVVAPKEQLPLVQSILTKVFALQGDVEVGQHLAKLTGDDHPRPNPKASKKFLIIDKAERNQTVTAVMAVNPQFLNPKDELAFFFGNHILFDSGLASIFSDEIRAKRGLAYSVGSSTKFFLERPTLSVSMNPVREKTAEAYKVTADLLKTSFETGSTIKTLKDDVWNRQWRSFKFGKILSLSSPSGRLAERQSVVAGSMSPEFYKSRPEDWKVSREEVTQTLTNLWKSSVIVVTSVGSAKELSPWVKKYFGAYKVSTIPYKDTISAKTY